MPHTCYLVSVSSSSELPFNPTYDNIHTMRIQTNTTHTHTHTHTHNKSITHHSLLTSSR
ncbi:hypothetical protein DM02DRAFT_673210 [Periconia macrospinosa]|uniref:Uncharacterized protein n=1 Tax=Periconia macrospinosa TaxID=97972 RepID=A0A2V1DNF6_9PLEO|nr:hypothetical protein DM02DRAFT_673210 [Periconia macrospinosa]